MKNLLKAVLVTLALLAASFTASAQQNNLTQTTLTTIITASQNVFALGSLTGITVSNNTTSTVIYIDNELMTVVATNATALTVTVARGASGTQASGHAAGTMVLAGNPTWFLQHDLQGSCVVANALAAPFVNVINGNQWLCSSVTLTWVPGFVNNSSPGRTATTKTVASATSILPTGPLFHVTGTTAIVNITQPVGCNATAVGGCQFTVIADGVMNWTAAGNIHTASGTVVAGTLVTFVWDASTSKWYANVAT